MAGLRGQKLGIARAKAHNGYKVTLHRFSISNPGQRGARQLFFGYNKKQIHKTAA